MNLKKSDKIIAIAAVFILIIAAIGVILYTSPEDEVEAPDIEKMKEFLVETETIEMSVSPDNTVYSVKDPIFGTKTYTGIFEVSSDNLEKIEIFVEYEDSKMGFIKFFKNMRADTLTVNVMDEEGNEISTESIVGSDNVTITIDGSSPLSIAKIKAKDKNEAQLRLDENTSGAGLTETYTIEVSLEHGEMILRPLAWLLEKLSSDSFTLDITASVYHYNLEEVESEEDQNKETSQNFVPVGVTTYRTLGLPGYH